MVVVVVDRDADVVQHAGGPQQLALLRRRGRAAPPRRARRTSAGRGGPRASTCSSSVRKRWARFSTDSRRTSSSSGGSRSSSSRSKKTPSRSPASVTSSSSKPPCSIAAADHQRAAEDHVAAVGLDPPHRAALGHRPRGQVLDQLLQGVAVQHEALDVQVGHVEALLHRGGQVADRASDAAQPQIVLGLPPLELPELAGHVLSHRLDLLGARRPRRPGTPRSPAPRPSRTDSASASRLSAMRMSCTLPPPTSIPKPSESVVELAIAR